MRIGFVLLLVVLSGCSQELYLGTRRIDKYEQTQSMSEKPAYCHFFNCQGGATNEK